MYGEHATTTRKLAQERAKEAFEAEKIAKEDEKLLKEFEAIDLNIYRSKHINDMGIQAIMAKYNKTRNQIYAALRRHEKRLNYTTLQNSEEAKNGSSSTFPLIQTNQAQAAVMPSGGGTLTALPMFNTGRHAIITNDIRDQALEDFMSSPDIFDGTVRFEGLKKILKEATDKVHVRNSHHRFNGDYSYYIVDKFIKDNKLAEFATAKARNQRTYEAMNDIGNNISNIVVTQKVLDNDKQNPSLLFNLDATTMLLGTASNKYNKQKKNLLFGLFGKKDSYRKINRSAAKVVGSNEGSINYCN